MNEHVRPHERCERWFLRGRSSHRFQLRPMACASPGVCMRRVGGTDGRFGFGRPKTFDAPVSNVLPDRVFERGVGNFGGPAPASRVFPSDVFVQRRSDRLFRDFADHPQGLPAASTPSGTSRDTTLPAPITARESIRTRGRMIAPLPTHTSDPMGTGLPNASRVAFSAWQRSLARVRSATSSRSIGS